jgi:AcrR family transcriptional regulator
MGTRPRTRDGSTPAEQRIFAATERLLATVTARDLSVAQILKEAKISRGTFYHYFSSKWEVIIALATGVMEDIHDWIKLFSGGGDEPRDEALRKSIEEGARVWAEHRSVVRAVVEHWREVPELRAMWLDVMERYIVEIAEEIDRDREAGLAPPGPDSRVLAGALMWSTANTLYMAGLNEADSLPSEEAVLETLFRLWRGAIFG